MNEFSILSTVKSQVPKALSRDRLERVKAKLSVVTLLLPKIHLRPGLITQESDTDEDSGNEAKNIDGSVIEKVAAAQKLFAKPVQPRSSCNTLTASQPIVRRSGVVSASKASVIMNSTEHSEHFKNLSDSRRELSSEPGLIGLCQDLSKDGNEQRKLSCSDLPRQLTQRLTPDQRGPVPTFEEEKKPVSVIEIDLSGSQRRLLKSVLFVYCLITWQSSLFTDFSLRKKRE